MAPRAPAHGKAKKKRCRKNMRSEASGSGPKHEDLDDLMPSLWKNLPNEFLESVLTKLPVPALKKFIRVSKRWKALIESEEFASRCDAVQPTMFYYDEVQKQEQPHIAIPNLKTNSWERHILEFLSEGERGRFKFVVADRGLLCFRLQKKQEESGESDIILVIHNPVTRKSKRLIVPHRIEQELNVLFHNGKLYAEDSCNMLVGLTVDRRTGRYRVVVALIQNVLPMRVFIYESASDSWKTSAADISLEMYSRFGPDSRWSVSSHISHGGDLYWYMQETEKHSLNPHYKRLIKYNVELDTWAVAGQWVPWGDPEFKHELHLQTFENRPFMVSLSDLPRYYSSQIIFPAELSRLVPDMGKLDLEDVTLLLRQVGIDTLSPDSMITEVFGGGEYWFIGITGNDGRRSKKYWRATFYAISNSSPRVTVLPKFHVPVSTLTGTFEASFKAFV